jgi:hypothetical protein
VLIFLLFFSVFMLGFWVGRGTVPSAMWPRQTFAPTFTPLPDPQFVTVNGVTFQVNAYGVSAAEKAAILNAAKLARR